MNHLTNGHSWNLETISYTFLNEKLNFSVSKNETICICSEGRFRFVKSDIVPIHLGFIEYSIGLMNEFEFFPERSGRFICTYKEKEFIHELPVFNFSSIISTDKIKKKILKLKKKGITAVHLSGIFERTSLDRLCEVTDHVLFRKDLKELTELGVKIFVDFLPLVSTRSSRKYKKFYVYEIDQKGRKVPVCLPGTDLLLLNFRDANLWRTLAEEACLLFKEGVHGLFLGSLNHWDSIFERNFQEMQRKDSDGEFHYSKISEHLGTIVNLSKNYGFVSQKVVFSPLFVWFVQKIRKNYHSAFLFMSGSDETDSLIACSGIIPQSGSFGYVLSELIHFSVQTSNLYSIRAGEFISNFFASRSKRIPPKARIVSPFGSVSDYDFKTPFDGILSVVDLFVFLDDIPLFSFLRKKSISIPNVYVVQTGTNSEYSSQSVRFNEIFSLRKQFFDKSLVGDVLFHKANFDAVLVFSRQNYLFCISFYTYPLTFETKLPIMYDLIEVINIFTNDKSYYFREEMELGPISLDIGRFCSFIYEINECHDEKLVFSSCFDRFKKYLTFKIMNLLEVNKMFLVIKRMFKSNDVNEFISAVSQCPEDPNTSKLFYDAFMLAYNQLNANFLEFDQKVFQILQKVPTFSTFFKNIYSDNKIGPIFFVAPELGPFSKVGGLSGMVWELATELAGFGLDVHCISPYYYFNSKGETDYLASYGITYVQTFKTYAPDEIQIGIHKGKVNGVNLWFLHNHAFFSHPYQLGDTIFKLKLLVVMAKAALELCCQVEIKPAIICTNDWATGLVPAYARHSFGNYFSSTRLIHIVHNLESGYCGKFWAENNDIVPLHGIHGLPESIFVDFYDHSFDPSLVALLTCDEWATVSKRYCDDLIRSSPYKSILGSKQAFAHSNGIRVNERREKIAKLGLSRAEAKAIVQEKYFGKSDPDKCLFFFVGRIVQQKGVHLITDCFCPLHEEFKGKLQVMVCGQTAAGDNVYGGPVTHRMWELTCAYPENFWSDPAIFFTDGIMSTFAADYVLIPSLFEPSGIVQQEAFSSGTPVIAFNTGGLTDTVFEFNKTTLSGNGFTFLSHCHDDYMNAVRRAVSVWEKKDLYERLRENAYDSVLSTETVALAWARDFYRPFKKIFVPIGLATKSSEPSTPSKSGKDLPVSKPTEQTPIKASKEVPTKAKIADEVSKTIPSEPPKVIDEPIDFPPKKDPEPPNPTKEEPVEQTKEEPVEKPKEEPVEETKEESVEKPKEEPVEQTKEEPKDDSSKKVVKSKKK